MKERIQLTDRIRNKKLSSTEQSRISNENPVQSRKNASALEQSKQLARPLKAAGITSTSPNTNQNRLAKNITQTTIQQNPQSSTSRQTSDATNATRDDLRAVKLMVEPFQFISYLQWDCTQAFNEHGTLKIKGLIAEDDRMKYVEMATRETWVCAKALDETDAEITLFHGILTSLTVDSLHQYHTMNIEVKTGTYLLDQIPHTRTFQPNEMTYHDVINTCIKAASGDFIMREKQEEPTRQFTVQYKSTDWAFIKLLAHRLGVVVSPEIKTQGKRLLLGLNHARGQEISSDHYNMLSQPSNPNSLIRYDRGVYQVKTRAIYELGDPVSFQSRRLFITQIKSYLEGSELVHTYTLAMLKTAYEQPFENQPIRGISMQASVSAVERDRVQISIHEDENKQSGNRWFTYATVYSSPDGTGFFAQPEIGDEVRIIFPTTDEAVAYVASSVHLEASGTRTNPDHKSWKNKHHKEVLFTPDSLTVTNNNGLMVKLDDNEGISIKSNRAIFIESDGELNLNSQAGVTVYGERNVNIQQGAAQIKIKDAIDIAGGKINMN